MYEAIPRLLRFRLSYTQSAKSLKILYEGVFFLLKQHIICNKKTVLRRDFKTLLHGESFYDFAD